MSARRPTLFWRLALGMALVATLAFVASSIFLYVRFEAANSRFREDTLLSFARSLGRDLTIGQVTLQKGLDRLAELHGHFAIVAASGAVLASSSSKDAPLVPIDQADQRYFILPAHGDAPGLFGLSIRVSNLEPPVFVQVAFPRSHLVFDSVLEEFVGDIAWIWIPFVLILLGTNVAIAEFTLRPLSRAAREAEEIGPASINARLSEDDMPPDVLAIVRAVNRALERLQGGYLTLERFAANIAHELRTPMAVIKAELSVSDTALARNLERDFESMERLVNQLIDRARLGGLHFEEGDRVDLCDVANRVGSFLAPIIIAKQRTIEVICPKEHVLVYGSGDFIFRGLRNLVENAVDHSPVETTLSVVVGEDRTITVLDRGPGFPDSKLDAVSRKIDRSNSDRSDGLGLGLSIVDETMAAHGGQLILSNPSTGGACAVMTFPR